MFKELLLVQDYHDFDLIRLAFVNKKFKILEIGSKTTSQGFRYAGIIYDGDKPTKQEIDNIIEENNIVV